MSILTDAQIARAATMQPIQHIAAQLGLSAESPTRCLKVYICTFPAHSFVSCY